MTTPDTSRESVERMAKRMCDALDISKDHASGLLDMGHRLMVSRAAAMLRALRDQLDAAEAENAKFKRQLWKMIEAAKDKLSRRAERAEAERDQLGRDLNRAKYGNPDFTWSVHKQAMAEMTERAERAEAERDAALAGAVKIDDEKARTYAHYPYVHVDAILAEGIVQPDPEAMQALIGAAEALVELHNLPPLAKRPDVFQMRMAALARALASTGEGE